MQMASEATIKFMYIKKISVLLFFIAISLSTSANNGYDLWLKYEKFKDIKLISAYQSKLKSVSISGNSATIQKAKEELAFAIKGLLGSNIKWKNEGIENNSLLIGTPSSNKIIAGLDIKELAQINTDGFIISSQNIKGANCTIITANTDLGILYGVFNFIRLLQTAQNIASLNIVSSPKIKFRMLNHWDNLNRTVERGYAGFSIWDWHKLPDYIDKRYVDYARANASIGINGTLVNNVNGNATILTKQFLEKVAALANVFRPYGIKVYLSARFSAPMEIGGLKTADPLDSNVRAWWKQKTKEIYSLIPDFGGFVIKANSEGQPGPQDYQRTHADGANMFSEAIAPYHGLIIWRAFVYSQQSKDRFKQAYEEFIPLDGKFNSNVIVQVKNGPIDFQPREPFSPLFGAMKKTAVGMEFQITQEYLGQGTHLVYEAPMFKEVLDADTYQNGKGSTVAKIVEGNQFSISLMAGVSNIGNDINWTSHPFAQANWYAFGRLAWDYSLSIETIAKEWIEQTFSNDKEFVRTTQNIMLQSHETLVNYMTPLGLAHMMYNGHHYGPMPWGNTLGRPDWNPIYYHKADTNGIGFDRTINGTNALAQYNDAVSKMWLDSNTCDEKYLLWFHHVSWQHKMKSGNTLWEELCYKYNIGVDSIKKYEQQWALQEKNVNPEQFNQVKQFLHIQVKDAEWWRDACLLYFQTFSKLSIPAKYPQPTKTLEYYKSLRFPFAPGN
jgi:alpha-glucuronidase